MSYTQAAVVVVLLGSLLVCGCHAIVLDEAGKYSVSWTYDLEEITFMIEAETSGWVGLGFSPKGSMAGADIIIGWVDSSGTGYITDRHADANELPSEDADSDITMISSSESDGKTKLEFKRKLNTCDENDMKLTSDTLRLIYAYGMKDPTGNQVSSSDYHGASARGSKSLYLFELSTQPTNIPANAINFDMTVDNYEVPDADTTYYCSFHTAPKLDSKHHVISYEPILTEGNLDLVHHIVVYACWGITEEHIRGSNKTDGVCFSNEMPEFVDACRAVVFVWAVGGQKAYYPENTGFPLGSKDGLSPEYFMMETHYDNPGLAKDSSGMRITYTPAVRQHDVGSIQIGKVYGIFVPPKAEDFEVTAYCHSSCTKQWIPEEGVNAFAVLLHAHLLGRAIKVEWYRDGKVMGLLASDDQYDFNFQENRNFAPTKKLLPGDSLKITCKMTSSDRSKVTYGGLASSQEMCLAFLYYYPQQKISNCESVPGYMVNAQDSLYTGLNLSPAMHGQYSVNIEGALDSISEWTAEQIKTAQGAAKATGHLSLCSLSAKSNITYDQYQQVDVDEFPDYEPEIREDPCRPSSASLSFISLYMLLITAILSLL